MGTIPRVSDPSSRAPASLNTDCLLAVTKVKRARMTTVKIIVAIALIMAVVAHVHSALSDEAADARAVAEETEKKELSITALFRALRNFIDSRLEQDEEAPKIQDKREPKKKCTSSRCNKRR